MSNSNTSPQVEIRNPQATIRNRRGLYALLAIIGFCVLIVGSAFSTIVYMTKRSPAYAAAEQFIRKSPEIHALVGDDLHFGWVPRGSILADPSAGSAKLRVTVRGASGSTRVDVLSRSRNNAWTVVSASYVDRDGSTRTVLPPLSEAGTQVQPWPVARHAQEHAANAFALFSKGEYSAAVVEYNQAVEANPSDAELRYWRAVALDKAGDEQKAAADLRKAIQLNPTHVASYEYLDPILQRQKLWDAIVTMWSGLIEAQPQNGMAYFYRAGGYMGRNDRAAAIADQQKACDLGYHDACKVLARLKR